MSAVILNFPAMDEGENRIREFRKERDWSQSDLGERIGTSHVMISELERGVTQLTLGYMKRLAAAFGCDPGDLLLPHHNGVSLSPREKAWLQRFRDADAAGRDRLEAMADLVAPAFASASAGKPAAKVRKSA